MKIEGMVDVMVRIKGLSPLLMHNGNLADPLDPISQQIAAISGKHHSKRTLQDMEDREKLEFQGGLYWDEKVGPYLPNRMIQAVIRAGARVSRAGKEVSAGLIVTEDKIALEYEGPRDWKKLYEQEFYLRTPVKLSKSSSVIRVRPRFDSWAAEFTLKIMTDVLNVEDVRGHLETAGRLKGIGDFRPERSGSYGIFIVEQFVEV